MEDKRNKGVIALKAIVVLLFSSGFFWECANIVAPQGGPRDTLPPRVMRATPNMNTVNFTGTRIFIEFDEYVQIKEQQKEFFSSPPMKKTPSLLIKGRGVQVDIKDTLLENTTYALNFGSSIRDNNEGNPLNGFRYVFSTGPEIDSLMISGYTVDAYKKDSVSKSLIFFFEAAADSMKYDSVLLKARPAAIGRAENNGIFITQNLKPIDYRVYAVEDKNSNFTYDPGVDKVGFLDGTINPLDLSDFDVWYDTTRQYTSADPQLYFRMFADEQFRRQNLTEHKRPSQHKLELMFSGPHPRIDTLILEGIDSTRIITEYVTKGRDTINLWLNIPSEELPDTIKGRISYMRHDSVNVLQPYSSKLSFFWKYVESREEQREREKLEKEREKALEAGEEFEEPKKPNPFKFSSTASGEVNPEKNISMEFDYPVVAMDSTQISLIRVAGEDEKYRVRYSLDQDSVNMRKWIISAPWTEGEKYELNIPAGVITNVAGQQNDSIKQSFSIMMPDKFGTLTVNIKGKSDSSVYILELLDQGGKVEQEKKFVKTGTHVFRFLRPGDVSLRVIEDMNANGVWDPGNLIERLQPERVEIYTPATADSEMITMKANWEIDIDVDMNDLFKPIDIEDIRRLIERQERQRYTRWLEEKAKKEAQRREQENNAGRQSSGTGMGGAMGGMGGAMQQGTRGF